MFILGDGTVLIGGYKYVSPRALEKVKALGGSWLEEDNPSHGVVYDNIWIPLSPDEFNEYFVEVKGGAHVPGLLKLRGE